MQGFAFVSKIIFVSSLLFLSSCAMNSLSLMSNPPKATVSVRTGTNGTYKKLGETPLLMSPERLKELTKDAGPFTFEFSMPGFVSKTAVVTELDALDMTINLELKPEPKVESNKENNNEKVNGSVDALFEVQRLIRGGRYDEARQKLDEVDKRTPGLSASYELRGGMYYLSKQYRESYDAYSQAASLNPESRDAQQMRKRLAKILGFELGREPALVEAPEVESQVEPTEQAQEPNP
jgi:tetratricopeptide (TPR) repeat protein